jgi:uncharacterized membrane protein
VPHLALTVAIALALVCVATLIFFVGHMAQRINVDVVIELVSKDVRSAIRRLTSVHRGASTHPSAFWEQASIVSDSRRGYLQDLDTESLACWAAEHRTTIRLLVRTGDYVFPGAPIALMIPTAEGVEIAIRQATVLTAQRASPVDIEYSIRQLVEVAVRALSPGINDPHTAISVIDRLGAALCDIVPLYLPAQVILHSGKACLEIPSVHYDGLTDAMFHLIRQNARGSAAVLIRMLEVLTAVAGCERDPQRLRALARHASLVMSDAERDISAVGDLDDVHQSLHRFTIMAKFGPTSRTLAVS